MVAIIKTGHSVQRILNYNENKVKQGVAACIGAGNYPVDPEKMSFTMKLNRFLKQLELNENVTRNSVHISLNFHASENGLEKEKLLEIADSYMKQIGFENQPYLVYQHRDSGHPHIHIVSIKVRADGSRIDMNNIGRNQSEKARKAIEKNFGLVAAQTENKKQLYDLKSLSVQKAVYGRLETKAAIGNVLNHVLDSYRFSSLHELNAVLGQYNVKAERGSEESRVYKNKGLLYRILDENGNPVGVPVKASLFYNKPTLAFLEESFKVNAPKKQPHKSRVKNGIDKALLGKGMSLEALIAELRKQGIDTLLRQNDAGLIYGITYIDHTTKCAFNGSALGKQYSAKALQQRCETKHPTREVKPLQSGTPVPGKPSKVNPPIDHTGTTLKGQKETESPGRENNMLETLLHPEQVSDFLPHQLKKKKKKRKNLNDNR